MNNTEINWLNNWFQHLNKKIDRLERITRFGITQEGQDMSALDDRITDLKGDITPLTSAVQGAVTLINGFGQMLADAVADALAKGATAEELQSLTDLHVAVTDQSTQLAAAVAAGTPGGGGQPTP